MRKFHVLFIVAVAALFTSCKKDEPVNNNSNGQYYFDAVIGGVQVKEVIPFNNMDMNLIAGSSLGGIDDVVFSANISNQNPGGSEMAISKGLMHNYTSATANEFRAFFTPGNYNYAAFGDDGITITHFDADGTLWQTDAGTGDQTGSTFSIISFTDEPDFLGRLYIKTTAQFSCKLYDENGNIKQATGIFVGLFGMI